MMRGSLSDGCLLMDNIKVDEYAVVTWTKESVRNKGNELDNVIFTSRIIPLCYTHVSGPMTFTR